MSGMWLQVQAELPDGAPVGVYLFVCIGQGCRGTFRAFTQLQAAPSTPAAASSKLPQPSTQAVSKGWDSCATDWDAEPLEGDAFDMAALQAQLQSAVTAQPAAAARPASREDSVSEMHMCSMPTAQQLPAFWLCWEPEPAKAKEADTEHIQQLLSSYNEQEGTEVWSQSACMLLAPNQPQEEADPHTQLPPGASAGRHR